jgi:hypothetical protein
MGPIRELTPMAQTEHFVTLFDHAFLPMGLALHGSLRRHAQPFKLWVLCMDPQSAQALHAMNLPNLGVIRLADIETPALLAAKAGRSWGEYCWTLSSFTFDAVFRREPSARRVTYLDADVWFLDDPRQLLSELDESGKQVLVTEHAYAPEYDQSAQAGRFCVQFVTFDASEGARQVRSWWQDRVLEECSSKPGKLGDQGYLNEWPALFGEHLHIVRQTHRTLAPWNARHMAKLYPDAAPVFYHFHGLRIISSREIRLYAGYDVGRSAVAWYEKYVQELAQALEPMKAAGLAVKPLPIPRKPLNRLGSLYRVWRGQERFVAWGQ